MYLSVYTNMHIYLFVQMRLKLLVSWIRNIGWDNRCFVKTARL